MRHLILLVALVVFAGLDLVFVEFSETPSAALTFAVLAYLVLLLLSSAAGSVGEISGDQPVENRPLLPSGPGGLLGRALVAALIPVVLLLILAYIPDIDDPLDPSATIQLASTFAVFWLLMSLALVGAILAFLSPRTGALEAVLAGGMVVLAQSLLSWVKADASGDAVQMALYTWMVWISICLIGAWVGLTLRQIGDFYLFPARAVAQEPPNTASIGT